MPAKKTVKKATIKKTPAKKISAKKAPVKTKPSKKITAKKSSAKTVCTKKVTNFPGDQMIFNAAVLQGRLRSGSL